MKRENGYINALLNIDNIFGESNVNILHIVITILGFGAPWLFWVIVTRALLGPWWLYLILSILLGTQCALLTFGDAHNRKIQYLQTGIDEYMTSSDLVKVSSVEDDGMITYRNGAIKYLITFYPMDYLHYILLSNDVKELYETFSDFNVDLFLLQDPEACLTVEHISDLNKYTSKEQISERMNFYYAQDDYVKHNTILMRYVLAVSTDVNYILDLQKIVHSIEDSAIARKFIDFKVCKRADVQEIFDLQSGTHIDYERQILNSTASIFNDEIRVVSYERVEDEK